MRHFVLTICFLFSVFVARIDAKEVPFSFTAPPHVSWGDSCRILLAKHLPRFFKRPVPQLEKAFGIHLDPTQAFEGAMGIVWRGWGVNKKREPIHLILKEARPGEEDYLMREFEALKKMEPSKVRMIHVNHTDYLVMELFPKSPSEPFTPADSLETLLFRQDTRAFSSRPSERNGDYINKVTEGLLNELEKIHKVGIIHGDLSLRNILVGSDEHGNPIVKIIDFGLASYGGTTPPSTFGTTGYMFRQAWTSDHVTVERDVRSAQRIELEVLFRDRFKEIERLGVKRNVHEESWYDPANVYDDDPNVAPELALVLASHIPNDLHTYRQMKQDAKKASEFPSLFAARWEKAYASADARLKDELIYELASAAHIGPKIIGKFSSDNLKKEVIAYVIGEQTKMRNKPITTAWTWHPDVMNTVKEFLSRPETKPYLPKEKRSEP